MMVQSLGGMEGIVEMEFAHGGSVLNKSKPVQESKLPINYLWPSLPMPLNNNVYHVGRGINTISWHDHCNHPSSRINTRKPYPALHVLVEHVESISRDADELVEWHNSNTLFRFAIAAHSNRSVQMDCLE